MAERGDLFWLQAQGDAPPLRCVVAAAGTGVLVAAGGVQRSVCEQTLLGASRLPCGMSVHHRQLLFKAAPLLLP